MYSLSLTRLFIVSLFASVGNEYPKDSAAVRHCSFLTLMQIFAVVDIPCCMQHTQTAKDADARQSRTHSVSHTVASTSQTSDIVGVVSPIYVVLVDFLGDKLG